MVAIETRTWATPLVWIDNGDGIWRGESIEVIRVDDWIDTPFGQMNCGEVRFGKRKWVTRAALSSREG